MEVYVVTKSFAEFSNGYFEEKTKRAIYKQKFETFETKEKAFISYIKAAQYIRELLVGEQEHFGDIFDEEDMEKWSVFFIGFHHECKIHYKTNPIDEYFWKEKNAPAPQRIVTYKIETISLDTEKVDETSILLKELA